MRNKKERPEKTKNMFGRVVVLPARPAKVMVETTPLKPFHDTVVNDSAVSTSVVKNSE